MPKEVRDGMEDGPVRVHDRHGVWCEGSQSKSSNNRELINMVEVVQEVVEGKIKEEVELLFLADNSVAEDVYYRGNFSDKEIFQLMLRLVYLQLRGCYRLHSMWISETSQIAAVIYGFSRVCLTDGIASSGSILYFMPLNETAFESQATLLTWVQTWIGVNNIEPLTTEGWFKEGRGIKRGRNNDNIIWMTYHSKGTF